MVIASPGEAFSVFVAKPIFEIISVTDLEASRLKLPSAFVMVPWFVPRIFTDAPAIGVPSLSVTLPVICEKTQTVPDNSIVSNRTNAFMVLFYLSDTIFFLLLKIVLYMYSGFDKCSCSLAVIFIVRDNETNTTL
jgi:hypothetical protein